MNQTGCLLTELLGVLELVDEEKKESSGKVCMTGKGPGKEKRPDKNN